MSRRGRGEGSIIRLADGRWQARVDLGWQGGRRRRKALYGRTRKDVVAKLTKALRDVQRGVPLGDGRQTLGPYLDQWLTVVVKPSVRPKTHHSYAQLVRLHLTPGLGHLRLARLEPGHVETFLEEKRQAGLSPRTCQYLRAVLRRALSRALKHGLVARNAAALADPPRSVRSEVQSLTPEQARVFLAEIAGHRLYPLIVVGLGLGLRQGEILGLAWTDLDLDRGVLRVRHALERLGKGWRLVEPKSEQSRRTLKLPAELLPILRAHRTSQLEARLAAGGRWKDHGFVFTSRHGAPLDGPRLNRQTKELLRQTWSGGLPDCKHLQVSNRKCADCQAEHLPVLHFHSLRHSCASFLLAQGVPARVVMEILGHSDIRLTLNTYSHVSQELQEEAARQMSAVLWSGAKA